MSRIVVLGAGAWGTAIAMSLSRRGGHEVTLWAHAAEEARVIDGARENTLFLPGFPLPADLAVTAEVSSIESADIVVSVIPSEFLRSTLLRIRAHLHNGQFVVSATKGIEKDTFLRMTQVISQTLEPAGLLLSIGAFSGPSFAIEVAQGQPTAVTVAFSDPQIATLIQQEHTVVLKGAVVTKWQWWNPHVILMVDFKNDKGEVEHWAGEASSPSTLQLKGWSQASFQPGDVITMYLYQSKTGRPVGRMNRVVLGDGTELHDGQQGGRNIDDYK